MVRAIDLTGKVFGDLTVTGRADSDKYGRTRFDQATLEDQAALLLNCSIVNAYEARECARRQGCLAEWISEE